MSAEQITQERIAAWMKSLEFWDNSQEMAIPVPTWRGILDALTASRAEVARLTEEARRSDAGRVEVPELTEALLDLACGPDIHGKSDHASVCFRQLSRAQYRRGWEDLASRLSPSPQPATGAAVEIPDYPAVMVRQSIGHTERHAGILEGIEWARKNAKLVASPQPSADVVVVRTEKASFGLAALKMMTAYKMLRRESPRKPHADIGWMEDLLSVGLDALRSSTNHDSKETP